MSADHGRRVREHLELIGLLACCAGLLLARPAVAATTLHVSNGNDAGPGSLRAQIAAAAPGDTVVIDPGVPPIDLSGGQIEIEKDLTVQGQGSAATTIDAGGRSRIFLVGKVNHSIDVTVAQLTLAHGQTSQAEPGGAIENGAVLVLERVVIADSHTGQGAEGGPGIPGRNGGDGGAIHNDGTLTISDSALLRNSTGSGGDGGQGRSGGPIDPGQGGSAAGHGGNGGTISSFGRLTITDSTISQSATGSGGRGGSGVPIDNQRGNGGPGGAGGSGGDGGAIWYRGSALSISGTTISGATAGDGGDGGEGGNIAGLPHLECNGGNGGRGGEGGAIFAAGFTLTESTISGGGAGKGGDGGRGGVREGGGPTGSCIDGGGGNGGAGGAIVAAAGTNALDRATITGSAAGAVGSLPRGAKPGTPGSGGAIANRGTMTITGSTISANGTDLGPGFFVTAGDGGGISSSGTLTVSHSTVSGNHAGHVDPSVDVRFGGDGGGIHSTGRLTGIDMTVTDNEATGRGGGLHNSGPEATISGGTFARNGSGQGIGGPDTVDKGGGAIATEAGTLTIAGATITANGAGVGSNGGGIEALAALEISDSRVSGNEAGSARAADVNEDVKARAPGRGGGIWSNHALSITNSTISGNTTAAGLTGMAGGDGAGFFAAGGALRVSSSTFSGNATGDGGGADPAGGNGLAGGRGAGVAQLGGTSAVVNSTFAGNRTGAGGAGRGQLANGGDGGSGAGLYVGPGGEATVRFSTFAFNTAGPGGGPGVLGARGASVGAGIAADGVSVPVALGNSILALNAAGDAAKNCSGPIAFDSSSISFLAAGGNGGCVGAQRLVDPKFEPAGLAPNGGPTQTIALAAGSPAIDWVPANPCTGPNGQFLHSDQRGVPRPQGVACDIGAYEYVADPPDTSIDSGPADDSTVDTRTPIFGFSGSPAGDVARFQCRHDETAWGPCTSPHATLPLDDGPHSFEVRAVGAGDKTDPTPAKRSFTVDTTPPETTIVFGPLDGAVLADADQSFTFSSPSTDVDRFQCRLYATVDTPPAFDPCASPQAYQNIGDGKRVFEVRAVDHAGNADPTPAKRTFVIDTQPPHTEIDSGPAEGSTSNDRDPSFTFSGSPPADVERFECRRDSTAPAAFAPCTSPQGYSNLDDGVHTFEVRAVDYNGVPDPEPAKRTFTIDTAPPSTTIASGPPLVSSGSNPAFTYAASEPGSTFECQFDGADFLACPPTGQSYSAVPAGHHVFEVRATDQVGNTGLAVPYDFTITAVPPPPPSPSPSPPSGQSPSPAPGAAGATGKQNQHKHKEHTKHAKKRKRCRKGFKLKKVKAKHGKVKRRCVRKKKRGRH